MAVIFTLFALENMFLESFQVGSIMLIGLFFYDVFWVFGTDVMETVAKSIDGPIKLLFPKALVIESSKDLSLLGLGDIIIPGIFIALCLRYDFLRNFKAGTKARSIEQLDKIFKEIPKPYFWSCVGGYVVGILTTVAVMLIFNRGQPALLYLVPGCIGSVFLCAFVRKEIKEVFNYSEEEEFKKH
jgi:minor histocompatibility antigen H13